MAAGLLADELDDLKRELDARSGGQEIIVYQADLSAVEAAARLVCFCDEKKIDWSPIGLSCAWCTW